MSARYEPRPIIRFDEEEIRQILLEEDQELPCYQQARLSIARRALTEQCGVNYQRCGGGRRRLPKRSH